MKNKVDLSVFEKVFSLGSNGCRETCECGKIFYDTANSWDWDDGEFELLEADSEAVALHHGVKRLEIENHYYVSDCKCWHGRAIQIINWLNANAENIGEYFREEKKHRIAEADKLPVDITFPFPEGFRSMVSAPLNATNIEVLMENGHTQTVHWAEDLSGEEQPPFQGWFVKNGDYGYHAINEPIAWKPIEKDSGEGL